MPHATTRLAAFGLAVGLTAATGHAAPPVRAAVAAPRWGPSLAPGCGWGVDPFHGPKPRQVTRVRGSAPTRLVAHAGVGDMTLGNLTVQLIYRDRAAITADFGTIPADGRDLPIEAGDFGDDGRLLAPGNYDVTITADITGPNCPGETIHESFLNAGVLYVLTE